MFKSTNLEDLKTEYRELCKKHHPDMGGDLATMQEINNMYDELFNKLKDGFNANRRADEKECQEMPQEYREVIEKIINIQGIEIELCGYWLWVRGNTKPNKDILKSVGFKWAKKREDFSLWFWHPEHHGRSKGRGKCSMDDIRSLHGSEKVGKASKKAIGA